MQLSAAPAFRLDFPSLRPGTMIDSRHGITLEIPGRLPDITARGMSWVTESTSTVLAIHDEFRLGFLRARLDARLEVVGRQLHYSLVGTVAGIRIPDQVKVYDITDARRGYLELRSATNPAEGPSTFAASDCKFMVDKVGPNDRANRTVSPIYQPGSPGYVAPPR